MSLPAAPRCWRQSHVVRFADLDAHGLASAAAFCRWLQETAGSHARAAAVAGANGDGLFWVLSELRLRVDRYPDEGERVTVETWPAGRLGGARGYRDFSLRGEAGEPVGAAASLWLLLDAGASRPVRLPRSVVDLRALDREPVDLPEVPLTAAPGPEAPGYQRTTRWHDLDANGHVTNARLVEWLLDAAPPAAWDEFRPSWLSVRFAREVRCGATVSARCAWQGPSAPSRHAIFDAAGAPRAVALAGWARRPPRA